jgi:hypothetical protein
MPRGRGRPAERDDCARYLARLAAAEAIRAEQGGPWQRLWKQRTTPRPMVALAHTATTERVRVDM